MMRDTVVSEHDSEEVKEAREEFVSLTLEGEVFHFLLCDPVLLCLCREFHFKSFHFSKCYYKFTEFEMYFYTKHRWFKYNLRTECNELIWYKNLE